MEDKGILLKEGHLVHEVGKEDHDELVPGLVIGVAADGSWVDVDWIWHRERMQSDQLVVVGEYIEDDLSSQSEEVECEVCGKTFSKKKGYYQRNEYAYCPCCCTW